MDMSCRYSLHSKRVEDNLTTLLTTMPQPQRNTSAYPPPKLLRDACTQYEVSTKQADRYVRGQSRICEKSLGFRDLGLADRMCSCPGAQKESKYSNTRPVFSAALYQWSQHLKSCPWSGPLTSATTLEIRLGACRSILAFLLDDAFSWSSQNIFSKVAYKNVVISGLPAFRLVFELDELMRKEIISRPTHPDLAMVNNALQLANRTLVYLYHGGFCSSSRLGFLWGYHTA
ncbi:hypothetical protein P154DRAFT_134502 [Amniculicola lignicola CBS 123094]|uniref:Uncharacterized protein n=1 Tax=Amniculicola lignicola CBS 123094 TaxID=1392246 RepID=A0A6A5WLR8_9PLEO|nr:hypothetical protein P154DRAFT_134502 [Amniculicola lignicola CBS 123094]